MWGVVCTLAAGGIVYYASTFAGDDTNVDAQITQAKDAFARNDLMSAFEQTNAVLARNPDEPRALTYNAVVRMSMGEVDKASSMLERATQRDPKLLDAWVALAQARLHTGQQRKPRRRSRLRSRSIRKRRSASAPCSQRCGSPRQPPRNCLPIIRRCRVMKR